MRRAAWGIVAVSLAALPACKSRERSHAEPTVRPAPLHAVREAARPPRPRTVANATPPRLPRLKAQAASHHVEKTGGQAPLESYPCGAVWTGEEEIPLECDETTDASRYGTPAVALIPYELLHAPHGDLPHTVDHRTDGFEGRVLTQGRAPACTAFSFTSQINHAIGLWTGQPGDVSVMQVWARYHNQAGSHAIAANLGKPLARDADWPYDPTRAAAWSRCRGEGGCLDKNELRKLGELDKRSVVLVEEVEQLAADDTLFDVIQAKLASGRDIGTGGRLPKSFYPVGEAGSRYVPDFREYGKGAHAFSLVGYTHVDGERYFLVKNSWGERWGDGGYAWAHEQTLRKIIRGGYVVIVDPVGGVGLRRHKRNLAQVAACAGGEGPDSVDGTCQPLCSDGVPRHGGYCGVTSDCTRGYVNVAGECVLAAPKAKGTEPKTEISFSCGPAGCLYTIPHDVEGCTAARCQKTCPAPDFRLGKGRGGLVCLE